MTDDEQFKIDEQECCCPNESPYYYGGFSDGWWARNDEVIKLREDFEGVSKWNMFASQEIDKLRDALKALMEMDVKCHQLQDRLQFSPKGRELLNQCQTALRSAK